MKLLDQVRDVVRESIISYSEENATQKICEVPGDTMLTQDRMIIRQSGVYPPPVCLWQNHHPLKKEKGG